MGPSRIVNFHYAYAEAALSNYGLGKAIAYDETGFLGPGDAAYRRQAWNFLLSGGGTFDSLDYSFSPRHEDGSDGQPNGPGGGSAALRKQLGILQKFLKDFALTELRPDREVVKHAAGVVARVLSSLGRQYTVYLDGNGPAELKLELPKGRYSGGWIDVLGRRSAQGELRTSWRKQGARFARVYRRHRAAAAEQVKVSPGRLRTRRRYTSLQK